MLDLDLTRCLFFMTQTFYIKNMVCPRCKSTVGSVLEEMGLQTLSIELGEIKVETSAPVDAQKLAEKLSLHGFELLYNRKAQLIAQIKALMLEYLSGIQHIKIKLSDFLATKTNLSYGYLSKIFSASQGTTIEKYFILLRIEKAKELLSYEQSNLTEIAEQLGYCSAQALSHQFKMICGLTVSQFRACKAGRRSLDEL